MLSQTARHYTKACAPAHMWIVSGQGYSALAIQSHVGRSVCMYVCVVVEERARGPGKGGRDEGGMFVVKPSGRVEGG